jgi:uncharacterized membrane protein
MVRVALVVSLVLNALLLGFIVGDFARPIRTAQGLGEYSAHYPDEIRRDLRRAVFADRRALLADFRAFRTARTDLMAEMRAPEPDRARIEALMAEVRRLTTEVQGRLQAITRDAVLSQPPEVRARIGDPVRGDLPDELRE